MKVRSVLSVLLASAMTFSLAACGGSPAPASSAAAPASSGAAPASSEAAAPEGGKTISLMGNANNLAKPYVAKVIEDYQAKTGNKIDLISIEDANFNTIATSKFATGDIPDVFMHFNDSTLGNYNVDQNFYYMNDEAWVSDLADSAATYSKDAQGNILGLPFWESSVSGCYYNKKLFDELGLKPATTQAEFDKLCQDLQDKGVEIPLVWSAGDSKWMYQFGMDPIFADNAELLNKLNSNQTTYADIPEMEKMAQWISDGAKKGWFGQTFLTDGWSDLSAMVGTGEAAMILIWDTWFYTNFDEGFDYKKEDFGLMPVFLNTEDNGTYEGGNLNMLMANKNGPNLEAALDFIRFCATPENYNAAFDGISTVSVFKGQNTNVQSAMVTEVQASLDAHLRASTAMPKIIGFSQDEAASSFQELLLGNVDAKGCIEMMDQYRISSAKALGAEGF